MTEKTKEDVEVINTYKLALFGHPVEHSLSPQIHRQFAEQLGLKIDYQLIDVASEDFLQEVVAFFHAGGHGANATLPHKQEAKTITANLSKMAELANAVNTLHINDKSEICGDNTDGYGFVKDLLQRCKFKCRSKSILILGAGGATQGIVPALLTQKPKGIVIANRTLKKAQKIARFKLTSAVSLDELDKLENDFDLIIHSSSLGHEGRCIEFLTSNIHEQTVCYDLSYGKAAKPFLMFAKKQGIINTYDGIGMLIEQAAKSFEIWFDKKPNTQLIKLS